MLGFITSNKFMRANYGQNLRKYLLENSSIKQIIDFGDLDVFQGLTVYPSITIMQKDSYHNNYNISACRLKELNPGKLDQDVKSFSYQLASNYLDSDAWNLEPNEILDFIRRINAKSLSVKDFCGEPTRGILTGLNEVFLVNKERMQGIIQSNPADSELFKPYVMGHEVDRYTPLDPNEFIIFTQGVDIDKYPSIKKYLEKFKNILENRTAVTTIGNKWFELHQIAGYDSQLYPKIVYPSVSSECRFTLNLDGTVIDKTCYFLSSESKYLLAILNSSLVFFVFRQFGAERRGGYFEFLGQYVSRLPIRRISFTTPAPERARLGAQLQELYGASNFERILKLVDACLPKDSAGGFAPEEKSDVVHDLLAFLAEQMLQMNAELQKEIKGFLGWLEGYVGARVDDLSPKTKVQSYYEHDYEDLLATLKKNKRKLAIDPARREPGEALRAEFEGSVGKLRPLWEKIAATDGLIDAVVYRLYGLTKEEIKIVGDAN